MCGFGKVPCLTIQAVGGEQLASEFLYTKAHSIDVLSMLKMLALFIDQLTKLQMIVYIFLICCVCATIVLLINNHFVENESNETNFRDRILFFFRNIKYLWKYVVLLCLISFSFRTSISYILDLHLNIYICVILIFCTWLPIICILGIMLQRPHINKFNLSSLIQFVKKVINKENAVQLIIFSVIIIIFRNYIYSFIGSYIIPLILYNHTVYCLPPKSSWDPRYYTPVIGTGSRPINSPSVANNPDVTNNPVVGPNNNPVVESNNNPVVESNNNPVVEPNNNPSPEQNTTRKRKRVQFSDILIEDTSTSRPTLSSNVDQSSPRSLRSFTPVNSFTPISDSVSTTNTSTVPINNPLRANTSTSPVNNLPARINEIWNQINTPPRVWPPNQPIRPSWRVNLEGYFIYKDSIPEGNNSASRVNTPRTPVNNSASRVNTSRPPVNNPASIVNTFAYPVNNLPSTINTSTFDVNTSTSPVNNSESRANPFRPITNNPAIITSPFRPIAINPESRANYFIPIINNSTYQVENPAPVPTQTHWAAQHYFYPGPGPDPAIPSPRATVDASFGMGRPQNYDYDRVVFFDTKDLNSENLIRLCSRIQGDNLKRTSFKLNSVKRTGFFLENAGKNVWRGMSIHRPAMLERTIGGQALQTAGVWLSVEKNRDVNITSDNMPLLETTTLADRQNIFLAKGSIITDINKD